MKRLDTNSLPAFLDMPGLAVLLVGADDQLTLALAEDFAMLWADCVSDGLNDIRFGYVDAVDVPSGRLLAAGSRPIVVFLQDGRIALKAASRDLRRELVRAIELAEQGSASPLLLAA
jgi:hypothetical protein